MDMDGSTTIYEQNAFVFLYTSAIAIAIVGLCSWSFRLSTYRRLQAKAAGSSTPARTTWIFTAISLAREIAYCQIRMPRLGVLTSLGTMFFFVIYTTILLCCLLNNVWTSIPEFWEALAMRAAYLSVAQLPFLIVLSTKKNYIAYLLDTSHERLIIYHQFIGVCLLMTTTLHMGYFVKEWLYYDVWKSEWAQMGASMLQWGFAAWGFLLLIVTTSMSLFRARLYDGWIILHLVTMLGFFVMLVLHLDPPYRVWAYVSLSIWVLDRFWRVSSRLWLNISPNDKAIFRAEAVVEALQGEVVRLTIVNFQLHRRPGQYIYLSIYKLGLHSHPFTIVSDSKSNHIILLVKAKQGLTRRLLDAGSKYLPPSSLNLKCSIEGPYGGTQTSFQAFDSAILLSGGTGGTFTINLLRDLVANPGCCRSITYIWVIRAECHTAWFAQILEECRGLASQNQVELLVKIWVTQDLRLTTQEAKAADMACGSSSCRCQSNPTTKGMDPSTASSLSSVEKTSAKFPQCCCMTRAATEEPVPRALHSGRPDLHREILMVVRNARGETGIAVCGPQLLTDEVRHTVVRISDERAVKKGTGAEALYLHVENQF